MLSSAPAAVHPDGGFGWLGCTGDLDLDHPVELWITCRMTHVAALGHLLGRPGCASLLDVGVRALTGPFLDQHHGGWHAALPGTGVGPDEDASKGAYEHAFVVLAASSATVAGHVEGRALLTRALETLMDRFWEPEHRLVADVWDPATGRLDPYRGVNANMHAVEALLAAADATNERHWLTLALDIATRIVDGFAQRHAWRIPEHFDEQWTPLLDFNHDNPADPFRPYGATIGHWLEWARLCLHLRAALGVEAPGWLLPHARSLFDASVRDGWAVDGVPGFVYTVDRDGRPVVRERMHWVAAEAVATAAALWAATGEPAYAAWYEVWWDHIATVFIDREDGSWHHELDVNNKVSATVWPGKPDLYHAVQATLLPRLPLSTSVAAGLAAGLLRD
ncbi:MAG: AGE family epimerase/isomerase [Actinomycetota bacterium]|nr:AGE family epimerase/isomerase [Actinomycetota bacterium]